MSQIHMIRTFKDLKVQIIVSVVFGPGLEKIKNKLIGTIFIFYNLTIYLCNIYLIYYNIMMFN